MTRQTGRYRPGSLDAPVEVRQQLRAVNRLRVQRRAAERAAYERENPVVSVRMPAEWVEWLESEAERRGVASAVLLREATMLLRRAYGGLPHDVEFNLEPACHGTDVSPHEVAQSPDR